MMPIRVALDAALHAEELRLTWRDLEMNEALRLLRHARAMDQNELARLAGMAQPRISDLETGRADPRWSMVKHVFRALDCAPLLLPMPLNAWPHRPAQWREEELDP